MITIHLRNIQFKKVTITLTIHTRSKINQETTLIQETMMVKIILKISITSETNSDIKQNRIKFIFMVKS
jgi:hypothetical protein